MSDYVTASFIELHEQAPMSAAHYLYSAKRNIDEVFGEGYAAKNPALVAAFILACSNEMTEGANAKVMGAALQEIARSIDEVAAALRNE